MKTKRIFSALAATAAAVLALTGCAGGDVSGGGDGAAIITANGSEPQNPLIPTNTNETGGGKVVDELNARLVTYKGDGSTENELAESIEPDEKNQVWTIKLRDDIKFSDDSPITADNFIKAWNYGANPKNAQLNSYFFELIEGYSAEEGKDVTELSGLKKVDDQTFTVTLTAPTADFATRLGYSAYAPLPDVAFEDMDAYGKNPSVVSGPYKFEAWENNVEIRLVANEKYDGPRKPANGGLTFKLYAQLDAAYSDLLAGNLDVLDTIPDSSFGTYESELGGNSVNQPGAVFQAFIIPERLDHFGGEEGKLRRQALSMAINREEVTDKIFQGTRTPATDFTSPVIDGHSDDLKNVGNTQFNAEKAKELWAKADAISPWEGTFEIAYNSDGGHQPWVDAVTNQIKNNLDIKAQGKPYASFAELRTEITEEKIQVAFRSGWQADYPGLNNFLAPLYTTNGSSNDGKYSNPEVDKLIAEGDSSASVEEANKKYNEAQEILLEDLPAVPLWYANSVAGWASGVNNVEIGYNGVPLYHKVTKE